MEDTPTKKAKLELSGEANGADVEDSVLVGLTAAAVAEAEDGSTSNSDCDSDSRLDRKMENGVEPESDSDSMSSGEQENPTSSSSEESSSGSDDDEEPSPSEKAPPDLKSRLAAFLPQLAKANETLEGTERIDDVDDDEERYIEMNLGLGVLSENKQQDGEIQTKESESESDSVTSSDESGDRHLSTLIIPPQQRSQKKRKIEEVT